MSSSSSLSSPTSVRQRLEVLILENSKLRNELEELRTIIANYSFSPTPPTTTSSSSSSSSSSSLTPTSTLTFSHLPPSIVVLDVGGTTFKTSRETLTKYPNSMLSALLHRSSLPPGIETTESVPPFFIDRSPSHFTSILQFLRTGKITIPKSLEEAIELDEEFEYFGLPFPVDAFLHFPTCYVIERTFNSPFNKEGPLQSSQQEVISQCCGRFILYSSSERLMIFDMINETRISDFDLSSYSSERPFKCGMHSLPLSSSAPSSSSTSPSFSSPPSSSSSLEIFLLLPTDELILLDLQGKEKKRLQLQENIFNWRSQPLWNSDGTSQIIFLRNSLIFLTKTQHIIQLGKTNGLLMSIRQTGNYLMAVDRSSWFVLDETTGELIQKNPRLQPRPSWSVPIEGGLVLLDENIENKKLHAKVMRISGKLQGSFDVRLETKLSFAVVLGRFVVGVKDTDVFVMEMHKNHNFVKLEKILPPVTEDNMWVYSLGSRIVVKHNFETVTILSPAHKHADFL